MTLRRFVLLAATSAVGLLPVAANAWMHGGGEAGHWHGTYVGPQGGVAHAGGTTAGWHGSTGWNHPDYGWHQPVTVNRYYNGGCYNCGGWYGGTGGAAVGAAVGLAAGTAIGAAAASSSNANAYAAGVAAGSAYALGSTFAALPGSCAYAPIGPTPYYNCSGYWLKPAYGSNGVYYTVVPTP